MEDGTIQYVNVYRRAYETLQYKFKQEDGSYPKWVETVGQVFNFGLQFDKILTKVEEGEVADQMDLAFTDKSNAVDPLFLY